ncbi:hypothetical protein Slin15195_G057900 [Septoria linicola]|uniref:Secreted protein n=1 Tax=Septoria linicola TaxID=215465 RepID=A0A9Q9EI55_9PEZI|nr:hypothetical protein Slin14017_G073750 [Septoria linicola]USW52471.1 hypothetical protein Slin15195_G057900 [Septoria linicola]
MKTILCALISAAIVAGLPVPLVEEQPASHASLVDHSGAWNWGWSNSWSTPGWSQPSRNPFDICETPEGKQLGASCSGGQLSTDETDGWYNEHTDVQFTSWTMGPPDKPGWNPFAPPATGVNRAGAVGGATIGGTRTGGTVNDTQGACQQWRHYTRQPQHR